MRSLREGTGLDLAFNLLGRGDHFRLLLRQIERLEFRAFLLLLLLAALRHNIRHTRVMCRELSLCQGTALRLIVRTSDG